MYVYVFLSVFIESHILDCIYMINRMDLGLIINYMVRLVLDRKMFALNYGLGKLYFFYLYFFLLIF